MSKSQKGSSFERDMCRYLSLLWTDQKDETLFWRTHSSGARFTTLAKKGKHLAGQAGDVAAVDARGKRLLEVFTISLKRGYSGRTFQDLIDALAKTDKEGAKPEQEQAGWIREARQAEVDAGSLAWMIILRRDRRQPMVLIPLRFRFYLPMSKQKELGAIKPQFSMCVWIHNKAPLTATQKKKMTLKGRIKYNRSNKRSQTAVLGFPMDKFLEVIDKKTILQIAKSNQ